ncbi:MAG: pyrroline-5-carboxylate reductase [Pseudomonadota bacterium]|nr:pyrroline-5-carboxylate reductase [Pseudomonadota bacterium]
MPNSTPILLIGAGKMGQAMLKGWLASDIASIEVLENFPSDALRSLPIDLNPSTVTINESQTVILAVKPQNYREVLDEHHANIHPEAMVISILAGISIEALQNVLPKRSIVRAMPNTPATVGQGLTALCAADDISDANKNVATSLMQAVGEIVWVENESMMDSVTAVSGSGPAYLFHFVEALTAAAIDIGFEPEMAETFARNTIIGSAALLESSAENATQLRRNVTSKGGTTQAALDVLMADAGLQSILLEAVKAAKKRSEELSKI